MIGYNLKDLQAAEKLVNICNKYPELQIDCIRGKYVVDPRSVLGLMSVVGGFVGLDIPQDNADKYSNAYKLFKQEVDQCLL